MCRVISGQTICKAPGCNRQIYIESNGMRHPFCGRTCASKYGDYVYMQNSPTSRAEICKRVGCNKPTYVEPNGLVHPYCGRTCAYIDIASSPDLGTTIEQLNPPPSSMTVIPSTSNLSSNSTIVPSDFYHCSRDQIE